MKRKDAFEEFLKTECGERLLQCGQQYKPGIQYFRNCLWWAFQAGCVSDDVRPSQTGELIREIAERGMRVPTKSMLRDADEIIKNSKL